MYYLTHLMNGPETGMERRYWGVDEWKKKNTGGGTALY